MSAAKPDGEHTDGRRKSENRRLDHQLHVRLSNDEYGHLLDAAVAAGNSPAELLREWFLTGHDYLSTACLHANRGECRTVCKFCPAVCRHTCHAGQDDTNGDTRDERTVQHHRERRQMPGTRRV